MKPSPDDITKSIHKSINKVLKSKTNLKRKRRNTADHKKQLFIDIITHIELANTRTLATLGEVGIDLSNYDDLFHVVIESLFELHFGKPGHDLIAFYLYSRTNPDGSVNELTDASGNIFELNTPEQLWDVLAKMSEPK
jgi:hypothetical protein